MPSFTTIAEAYSPILKYSGTWSTGTSDGDPQADKYSQGSFMVSQKQGASVSLSFYGTSVTVVGAKRFNHGPYHARIDNTAFPQGNGSSSTDLFNSTLFSTQVDLGFHNLTFLNDADKFVDIDYIAFDTTIGQDSEELIVNTYQDSHPSFTYTPANAWQAPAVPGSAVALYGPIGPNNTQSFSVRIDSGSPAFYSAQNTFSRSQQLLYFASNLGPGMHNLTAQPRNANGQFAIDYANVYTTASLGGSFISESTVATASNSPPAGLLAALAATSALAFFSLLTLLWLFYRRRRDLRERRLTRMAFDEKETRPSPFPPVSRFSRGQSDNDTVYQSGNIDIGSSTANNAPSLYPTSEGGSSVHTQPTVTRHMALHNGADGPDARMPEKYRLRMAERQEVGSHEDPAAPPQYSRNI
ncbi:hypothetical protein CPB83DRAFT_899474 [Crepidotus variabilis]|uniref:Uncharacterized protein n=1 Tax=Crepidotus variabilis TaxID=179855 RepID=A0A9P6JJ94_9AGAR|nr:hypothetical protein CPB83DRAFT_899474 [Crepidotus variabilis]